MMILNVLQSFLEKGVQVLAIKEECELGDNIQSKVLAFALGLSAEIARNLGVAWVTLDRYMKKMGAP